ncbi:uncharacterized protein LOC118738310 [Rhagoletis pomonella]|uniref:uncharacterized protein LOC118738310 n=1 Tax=Rhagoletis pomonella TaxID=28610 RepID=UPI00177F2CE0|nr:uncharacterized protein LOC118738310 [Rhagoletis pomonella]
MKTYPDACSHLLEQFYMDDYIGGAHNLDAAAHIASNLRDVLLSAGMELRKWSSSCMQFIADIPPSDRETSDQLFFGERGAIKTLGMWWQPQPDVFRFRIKLNEIPETSTKREILSMIARIFDPLGWLSPMVVYLKIFMKRLWSTGIGWDDPIPQGLPADWNAFRNGSDDLSEVSICRWMQLVDDSNVELHVFADSSKLAYGAVVYMRVIDNQDNIHISLVASKTRIAPFKAMLSIPRLELCAALLAAQLVERKIIGEPL